jgi:hypothetical protein
VDIVESLCARSPPWREKKTSTRPYQNDSHHNDLLISTLTVSLTASVNTQSSNPLVPHCGFAHVKSEGKYYTHPLQYVR